MLVLLAASGLGLLALPAIVRPLGRRLAPDEWARLSAIALLSGALAIETAAVLAASATVLRAAGVHPLADACERVIGSLLPGGPTGGWLSAGVALALPALAASGLRRARCDQRATRVEPWIGDHRRGGDCEIVRLPTDQPLAVSVPGRPPQVIVSEGLVGVLAPAELAAVLDHEAAHLQYRHDRYLLLAILIERTFGGLPLVRRSTVALRAAVERWADEVAAAAGPDARRHLRDALLAVAQAVAAPPAVAALTHARFILERLDALELAPPLRRLGVRAVVCAPGGVLGGSALASVGWWAGAAGLVVRASGHCPL